MELSGYAFDERGDPGQMLGEMMSGVAINDIQGGGSVTFAWLLWQIVTIRLLKIYICQPLEHLQQLLVGAAKLSERFVQRYTLVLLIDGSIDLVIIAFQIQHFFNSDALMARLPL